MLLSLILGLLLLHQSSAAADNSLLQELYISPRTQTKPEAIIFYNSANPCENCDTAINLTINILRNHYQDKLHAYLINLATHPEFITAFHLQGPLSLVIIRISDRASFGYEKLESLQSRTHAPQDYQQTIIDFIDNFLDWSHKN